MARPKCYHIPKSSNHGILRGKDGQPTFFSNENVQILDDDAFLDSVRNIQDETISTEVYLKIIIETVFPVYEADQTIRASSLRSDRLSLVRATAMIFAKMRKFKQNTKSWKR